MDPPGGASRSLSSLGALAARSLTLSAGLLGGGFNLTSIQVERPRPKPPERPLPLGRLSQCAKDARDRSGGPGRRAGPGHGGGRGTAQ